jgi:diguanylate cyclase (GGDEF)-like protein/PAS domain S-box-containing protein
MESLTPGSPGERSGNRTPLAARGRRRSAYAGSGSIERLGKAVLRSTEMGLFAMRYDGTLVFVNEPMGVLIGRKPADCLGHNVLEWLHPDEFERAAGLIALSTTQSPPPGTSRFTVAHADGSWIPLEVTGAVASDGSERLLVVYCRNGAPRLAIEEVMTLLLRGLDLPDIFSKVCNVIEWPGYGTHVAISWFDDGIFQEVNTGLPPALTGGDDLHPTARGEDGDQTLWARCRATGDAIIATVDELDPIGRALAADLGVVEVWIVPVAWDETRPAATITIWTAGGGRSPQVHAYGMEVARNIVELILRWTDQQRGLERAAHHDALTGLANRRVFFDSLPAHVAGGAVLYCDLDRFKPVNDTHGHSAGDEVLRAVAKRISRCVRDTDLVSRLGGDEFAVICGGASQGEAAEVAARIERALDDPFAIDGTTVSVGVSIGIAHTTATLTEAIVDAADGALAEAKAAGRSTYRIAP